MYIYNHDNYTLKVKNMSERRRAIINLSAHGIGVVRMFGNNAVSVGKLGVMGLKEYSAFLQTQKWAEGIPL